MSRGTLIVIEGLDGSGKATQAAHLADWLRQSGRKVSTLSFPCYDSESSALVRMYLAGTFGTHPDDVNGYAAAAFYAVDRYASYRADWKEDYDNGALFVADRYTTSNAVYQMSKLPPNEWESYRAWLSDFEYDKLGIPRPDLVLYLDVEPAVSAALLAGRYAGDESKKDIHERDALYQKKSREAALTCAAAENWRIIHCCADGNMRSVEAIAADICKAASEVL